MKKEIISPNKRITAWGIGYLLFQAVALPYVLILICELLGIYLDDSRLNLLYYIVNFAVLVGIFWRFLQASLEHALQNLKDILIPAIVYFCVYRVSSYMVDIAIYLLFPDFFNVNDANISSMAQDQMAIWAFATIVLVPPAEELLFRGALFGGFYNKYKFLAWPISVLGFALMHIIGYIGIYSWDHLLICAVQYLPAGICLAAAYRQSGNIFSSILMHSTINALAMLSMALM